MGVTGSSSGGGRTSRALRYLLLFVLALAAVEYLFGSLLDTSPLKTYLYMPIYNTTNVNISSRVEKPPALSPKHNLNRTDSPQPSVQLLGQNTTSNSTSSKHTHNNTNSSHNTTEKALIENTSRVINATMGYNVTTPAFITKIMESINNNTIEDGNATEVEKNLCQENCSDLGPITVNKTEIELKDIEKLFPEVFWGGRYSPPDCQSRHKVAIIVPYRDRQQHLAIFLKHMHPFLMKQQLEYGIFIVEQAGQSEFNRAKLMNVGFVESERLKAGGWKCFIFHDIDLLPLDERNMYSCPRQPRHMSASIDVLHFSLPYEDIFGGVSAMTKEQFTSVNGFSNKYWGWGGEDDDMSYRLKKKNYHVARYKMSIARYTMLEHKKSSPNPKRYQLLSQTSKTFLKDGLTTLEYELIKITQYHLYTHILVNIDESS